MVMHIGSLSTGTGIGRSKKVSVWRWPSGNLVAYYSKICYNQGTDGFC